MTAQTKPRNLLEATMLEFSVRRAAERIAQEQRAVAEAAQPPTMKEVHIKDQSGRTITSFEGSAIWLRDFAMEPKRVISITTK
jgi:hypothetical protein